MTADEYALLREALPCVQYSVNKWAERACAIAQKSFRFPSGAVPTQQQVDETFDKWKQMERLAARITAALAEKDDGGWMPIETAPRDRSVPVLITGGTAYWEGALSTENAPLNFIEKAYWNSDGDVYDDGGDAEFWYRPDYWHPLPPLPKGAK